jgi:hypothetical protein
MVESWTASAKRMLEVCSYFERISKVMLDKEDQKVTSKKNGKGSS